MYKYVIFNILSLVAFVVLCRNEIKFQNRHIWALASCMYK